MKRSLRVLIVEDSEDDTLLLLREMRRGGYEPVYLRVDRQAAMSAALDNNGWDVIITGYSLVRFSGVAAIGLVREKQLDIPVIVVSGAIGEEIAVTAMKAGAHDYIMKGNLARLVPAIRREISDARERRERRSAQQALRESELRYRLLFHTARDAIFVHLIREDGSFGHFIEVNEVACHRLDYCRDEYARLCPLDITEPGEWDGAHDNLRRILSAQQALFETVHVARNGRKIPVEVNAHLMDWGGQRAVLSIARDITDRKQVENKLRYISLHDSLTGLYNRFFFEQKMQRLEQQRCGAVGMVVGDVDGLKLVNDTAGHYAGDEILRAAGAAFQRCFPVDAVIARIGGDEFAALLCGRSEEDLQVFCQNVRQEIARRNQVDRQFPISLSLGFAVSPDASVSLVDIFRQADNHMYREKLHQSHSSRSAIVQTLMKTLEARDFITEGHADRMEHLIGVLGNALGLSEREMADIRLLAQFHDIGKVGVPDRILFKPGPLTQDEFCEMQRHCEIGHRIAQSAPELAPIADCILKHHEWWNGKGYPLGLKGGEIPVNCRILTITDAFDAMTSDRPYRRALDREQAVAELIRCAGTQFDPELVKLFVAALRVNDKAEI